MRGGETTPAEIKSIVVVVGVSMGEYAWILIWHDVPMRFWKFLQYKLLWFTSSELCFLKQDAGWTVYLLTIWWNLLPDVRGEDVHRRPSIYFIPVYSVH